MGKVIKNIFKEKLTSGEKQIGAWNTICNGSVSEILVRFPVSGSVHKFPVIEAGGEKANKTHVSLNGWRRHGASLWPWRWW